MSRKVQNRKLLQLVHKTFLCGRTTGHFPPKCTCLSHYHVCRNLGVLVAYKRCIPKGNRGREQAIYSQPAQLVTSADPLKAVVILELHVLR